jgi:hypothetical protein
MFFARDVLFRWRVESMKEGQGEWVGGWMVYQYDLTKEGIGKEENDQLAT